jgi:hypothetical protein
MPGLKTWKVSLPEDSPVLKDVLEYGSEMGMQPAETTRVILTEWSRAMRGRNPFGGVQPHMMSAAQVQVTPEQPKEPRAFAGQEKAKTRGTSFAKRTMRLDDD